ncbi:portal protein [Hyphomicrobium sp. ghe19]|uniref:portal protein n=1 Tax=Hyphomicrobium sp. ghe19 TaxID=2682968 RepID=UPI00136745A0|nr:hypothetical protein HYPP_01952 [Hyphomicrobium sp. ghe19]
MNAPSNETQIAYHRRRCEELKQIRQPWESDWQELASNVDPTRYRAQLRAERAASRKKIIDGTGTLAYRTLKSGMHSGLTSPARPWFKLGAEDPDLRDFAPVKQYLSLTEERLRKVFSASNIYTSFHTGYGDLGLFGQSCGILVEDDEKVVRIIQLLHGTFWLSRNDAGRATTLYRCFRWSVQRIVARFGLDNVSSSVRSKFDAGRYDETFVIWHAIEPRLKRNSDSPAKWDMPYLSNYWEEGSDANRLLEESGFEENPIIAPPWELSGDDHYATSPGQDAIGDVKMLQKEQTRKLEGIDKQVRPPMTGPTSMRNNPASLLPGSITYVDDPNRMGYREAMQVRLQLGELREDIHDVQQRIERTFYADLFLMLANMEGIQPRNQFEIAERKEEKLLALGPVLENIYNGQLEPVIERTYAIMNRRELLPPPPPDLQKKNLGIEYTSMLAQAQKAVATGAIERGVAFVGQLSAVKPDVLDKIDADEAVDVYFDYIGVPPSIVVPDDDVAKVREARAQQQKAAEQAAMASQVAPAAKQGAEAAAVLADAQNNPGGGALLQRLGIG